MNKSTRQHYKEALETIASNDVNWKNICVKIAQANPRVFNEAVKLIDPNEAIRDIEEEAKRIGIDEGKIPAIRFLREKLHLSLHEAKNKIESLIGY